MNQSYEQALHQLSLKFLDQLKEHKATFSAFFEKYMAGQASDADKKEACALAHRLAGSGKTFGFALISEKAAIVEEALEQNTAEEKTLTALEDFIDAIKHTLNQPPPAQESAPTEEITSQFDTPQRVLVADDDALIQELVTELFADSAVTVDLAADGAAALESAKENTPDLIVLDINMPKLSGLKVLEALKLAPETAQIPVIMLTRKNNDESVVEGIMGGASDYIIKTGEMAALRDRIIEILERTRLKVLIADDDMLIRQLLQQKMSKMGYTVHLATQGAEALAMVSEHKPNLVLLDIMMPAVDGLAVLQQMKNNPELSEIPVVLISAKNQQQTITQALERGADDYILKPFDVDEVANRLATLLATPPK